ncbi:MAG: glycosyl hydrolase [bacterium]
MLKIRCSEMLARSRRGGIVLVGMAALVLVAGTVTAADDLAQGFVAPPDSAKPWAFWFRQNGQISQEGITRDFREMSAKGVGGVILWDNLVNPGSDTITVPINVRWLDPKWWELYRHTIKEAKRFGIGLSVQLCWCINCGGPWITPENTIQRVVCSEVSVKGPSTFNAVLAKPPMNWDFYRDIAVLAVRKADDGKEVAGKTEPVNLWPFKTFNAEVRERLPATLEDPEPEVPGETRLLHGSLVELTGKMDKDGRLSWEVPEGDWMILRIGHTADIKSRTNSYVAPDHGGFEVNVLNREAMELHMRELAQKLVDNAGSEAGKALKYLHTDSWEMPPSNWTQKFREEFRRRRGYDLLPYLPVLAGKLVESREATNRFLWDFRRTIGDLIAENHYGVLREFAARYGMGNDCEAGGMSVHFDALQTLGKSESPMGEIWAGPLDDCKWFPNINTTKQAASAAHIYGRKFAAAETFTSLAPDWIGPHWEEDPAMLKPVADVAFGNGINRIVAHTITHSPSEWGKPGLEYFAGSHMNPNVTWWEQSGAWFKYLGRCDYLLQQGLFVADACYFYGEGVPNYMPSRPYLVPGMPAGYDYDGVNAEVLLTRMSVKDGRIVLPDGMSYRVLVLPPLQRMTPTVLKRVKELVEDGATVIGPKPISSPSLSDYPVCDEIVKTMADAVWGDCDGQKVKERKFGKGRIIWGMSLDQVLLADGVKPDFDSGGRASFTYTHRSVGNAEIYFVANRTNGKEATDCVFRVSCKQPEIWNPVTGEMRDATAFTQANGRTTLPLEFAPYESLFVVFRKPVAVDAAGKAKKNFPTLIPKQEITGAWTVKYDPQWGGPESAEFSKLEDWSKRPEEGIKYYSGAATYVKAFNLQEGAKGARMFLDLGKVKNVAEVKLNGKDLGVVWTAPWQVEITHAVKPGDNRLEIKVVNLWPNRLIGDQLLPADKQFTKTNVTKFRKKGMIPLESGLLGPVTLQEAEAIPLSITE